MRRFWVVAAMNVAVICGLVVLTAVADSHLDSEIKHKQARYGACASTIRTQLVKRAEIKPGTPTFNRLLANETRDHCGWSALASRRPADVAGSAFLVLALGLADLLLWRIWRVDV